MPLSRHEEEIAPLKEFDPMKASASGRSAAIARPAS